MITSHKRFIWVLLAFFCASVIPIVALNMALLQHSLAGNHNTQLASQWQQSHHGVVNAPSSRDNQYFKQLRMQDRLPQINTVVFGASTSFGINQSMFPENMRIYNFSKNGIGLGTMIGEAEYLMNHAKNVQWLVIPLDWSIGFIYESGSPPNLDIFAAHGSTGTQADWMSMLRDALSYPRVEGLFRILKDIAHAENKSSAFRQVFLQISSDEYLCPDGKSAMDFDIQSRGSCQGFSDDGSWTFNGINRVDNAQRLIMLAMASNSKYSNNLQKTGGMPNAEYLRRLAALAHRTEQRGGGAIFFMPPLLSGMEAEFEHNPNWNGYLARTKTTLHGWAEKEHLILLDTGQSERYGCTGYEFSDEHHAVQSCYQKIFANFWQNNARSAHIPPATPDGN
jgi:hypothetical protein